MIRFTFNGRRNEPTSVPRDTRAPPALIHVFGQPAPTAFITADFPTWPKEQLVPMHPNRPPAMMMPMPSGLGLPTQYYPPYPQHGYGVQSQHHPAYLPHGYSRGYTPPTQHHSSYLPHAFPPYGYPPPPTQHYSSYLPHSDIMTNNSSASNNSSRSLFTQKKAARCNNAKKKATMSKKKAVPKKKKAATKKTATTKKKAAPTDSVLPKNLSEILEKNVSTFPKGFAATISSELFSNLLFEVLVKYKRCDQATDERPILHQRHGKGPDGSGCSHITIDWGHIKEVVRALGPDGAPGCQQFIKHFYKCFLDPNRESGCTLSIGRYCQIRLYDGGATSSKHWDATRNMLNRYMSSLCVNPKEVRGLNLFGNYYVDGKQQQTTDIVAEYTIPSGTSIMMSALAAGNAQGWGSEFPPTTFSSTEYGDETFLMHQSTPCKGRNMCIIIDFDKCEKTVYQSFLEKNCNQTTFEKGLELRADVEQAVTEEFELPRSKGVRLAMSEAMVRHHANPDHVFNSMEFREAHGEVMSKYWSNQKNHEAMIVALTGRSWTLTGPRHQPPPGVVVMQPCGYCGQPYHYRKIGQHEKGCRKNPNNVADTTTTTSRS